MKKYHVYKARTELHSLKKSNEAFAELVKENGIDGMREWVDSSHPESTSVDFLGEFDTYEEAAAEADHATSFSIFSNVAGSICAEVSVGDINWPDDSEEWGEDTDPGDICVWEFERHYPSFDVEEE